MKKILLLLLVFLLNTTSDMTIAQVNITSPSEGEKFNIGEELEIKWKHNAKADMVKNEIEVKILLSTNNGEDFEKVIVEKTVSKLSEENSYTWEKIDVEKSENCKIKITDMSDIILGESSVFVVKDKKGEEKEEEKEKTEKKIVIKRPSGFDTLLKNETYLIEWNSTGLNKDDELIIKYSLNYGKSWNFVDSNDATVKGDVNHLYWKPTKPSELYLVYVLLVGNNEVGDTTKSFIVKDNTSEDIALFKRLNIGIGSTFAFENGIEPNSVFTSLTFSKKNLFNSNMIGADFQFFYGKSGVNDTTIEILKDDTVSTRNITNTETKIISVSLAINIKILNQLNFTLYSEYRNRSLKQLVITQKSASTDTAISKSNTYTSFNGFGPTFDINVGSLSFKAMYCVGYDPSSETKKGISSYLIRILLKENNTGVKIGTEIYGDLNNSPGSTPNTFLFYLSKDISVSDVFGLFLK